jgi:SH3-like domain-containing protein
MELESIGSGLGKRMTRREAVRLSLGASVAVVAAGVLAKGVSATSGSAQFRTTTALNLRKKPSTSAQILAVMPANTLVANLGQSSNGFSKVQYNGIVGWAYSSYLTDVGGGQPEYTWLGDAKTTSAVNFRNEPSTSGGIIYVIAQGKIVTISDWVENGYRFVDAQGSRGWIYDDYLAPVDEETGPLNFKTTTAVNLRANPSTSAKIKMVVPAGKTVIDYDLVMSNGFRGVDYNGNVGWIYDAYLQQI